MPKYLKDTKLAYYKIGSGSVDDEGVFHKGGPYKVADLWSNFKGVDTSEHYALSATWVEPMFKATFTRPAFPVEVGDYICHEGKFYEIKTINDLTGKPHSDVVVIVQYDSKKQSDFEGI